MDKPTPDKRHDRTQDRPYQIVAYLGAGDVPPLSDVKVVRLAFSGPAATAPGLDVAPEHDPAGTTLGDTTTSEIPASEIPASEIPSQPAAEHPAIAVLNATGLTAGDVRSRILVLLDATVPADRAVVSYAVFSAFCGRRLDVAFAAALTTLSSDDTAARNLPVAARPDVRAELVVVADHPVSHPDLADAVLVPSHGWTPEQVATLRWARRVVLDVNADPVQAIRDFVTLAAVRARGDQDRFPHLLAADGAVTSSCRWPSVPTSRCAAGTCSQRAPSRSRL
jgi:hypothetical protein